LPFNLLVAKSHCLT